MRILIAEDEFYARKALVQRIRSLCPGCETVECEDGLVAIEEMQTAPCEILFLDLMMPEMNGLEVAEQVARRWPEAWMIFLTGFNEFEYARTAIRSGVREYLLKPVSGKDLERALGNAIQGVSEIQKNSGPQVERAERSHALSEFLEGRTDKLPDFFHQDAVMQCFLLSPAPASIPEMSETWSAFQEHRDLVLLAPGERGVESQVMDWARNMDTRVRIGCSRPLPLEHLHDAYRQARTALSLRLVENSRLHRFDTVQSLPLAGLFPQASEERFAQMLRGKEEDAAAFIHRFIEDCRAQPVSPLAIQDAVGRMCGRMNYLLLEEKHGQPEEALMLVEIDIQKLETLDEVEKQLMDALHMVASRESRIPGNMEDAVRFLRHYVEMYYDGNISFHELAEKRLFMNASYLSRQFRQMTGMSFRDYLVLYRMKKAREMLIMYPRESIMSIGRACGYADASQFIALFRRTWGMTPSRYRKALEQGEINASEPVAPLEPADSE